MKYLDKAPFAVKTGARRDCVESGHWPRSVKNGYECVFCGKVCTRNGQSVEVSK